MVKLVCTAIMSADELLENGVGTRKGLGRGGGERTCKHIKGGGVCWPFPVESAETQINPR